MLYSQLKIGAGTDMFFWLDICKFLFFCLTEFAAFLTVDSCKKDAIAGLLAALDSRFSKFLKDMQHCLIFYNKRLNKMLFWKGKFFQKKQGKNREKTAKS